MIVKSITKKNTTRLLNPSLPDIDIDFEKRDEVKRYLEEKYGDNHVCSVGTYGTFKIRAAFQDVCRVYGVSAGKRNTLTKYIDKDATDIEDLFIAAIQKDELRELIQSKPEIIDGIFNIIHQPKNSSIHACATIITPKTDRFGRSIDIYKLFPVKIMGDKNGESQVVSEWEGPDLEQAGYLKADILGLNQLEKFSAIFKLIEKNYGIKLRMEVIPLEDQKAYDLFSNGYNFDVFQMGSSGLKAYCQDVKPFRIDDLIAVNALYRPSAMTAKAHEDFVKIRNGEMQPEYDWGCEEITKETYGLQIYQETQMRIVQELGDFNLEEADKIRKAIGKKKIDEIIKWRDKFVDNAIEKGCPDYEAEAIWDKIAAGAEYSFNKSHSTCYAIMGYISNWLKANYPKEFWTVTLGEAKKDDLPEGISEIGKIDNGIKILPPDINKSGKGFTTDFETGKIYWSIDSIKFIAGVALSSILSAREKDGKFFSIEEFIERVDSKVNKRCLENLVISGAFDDIYNVKSPKNRYEIMKQLFEVRKEPIPFEYTTKAVLSNFFWELKQKEVCGYGDIDMKKLSSRHPKASQYHSVDRFFSSKATEKRSVLIGGLLNTCLIKETKNGDPYAKLQIENNSELMTVMMWSDTLEGNEELLKNSIGKVIFINGKVSFSDYDKKNNMTTTPSSEIVIVE